MCLSLCVRVCMYLYIIIIMCSAGPEVAVLALKQIQYIGEGGGGVVVAGLQVACEAHIQGGKVLGHPPPPPEKIMNLDHLILIIIIPGTSDFLCRFPLTGHSYILLPSIPPLYRFHACAIPHVQ